MVIRGLSGVLDCTVRTATTRERGHNILAFDPKLYAQICAETYQCHETHNFHQSTLWMWGRFGFWISADVDLTAAAKVPALPPQVPEQSLQLSTSARRFSWLFFEL